jgi:hypothetical protein
MKTVTLDTNSVDDAKVIEVARIAGYTVTHTSVTDRELDGTDFVVAAPTAAPIVESFVFGESSLGSGALAPDVAEVVCERLLKIISHGSFPVVGRRENLTKPERRQLRDAMILSAHIQAGRDIFVTNDTKGFIANGRRELIEREFATKVMTSTEFIEMCTSPGYPPMPAPSFG